VKILRPLSLFGYDDAPHGHMDIALENVPRAGLQCSPWRRPAACEIAQGRLGPGRIHHCMRLVGVAERALELMCKRGPGADHFGKPVRERTVTQERSRRGHRIMIEVGAPCSVLKAAHMMDTVGNKAARAEIADDQGARAPTSRARCSTGAIQAHGGGGMSEDFPLAYMYAHSRSAALSRRTDEVHRNAIAKLELSEAPAGAKALNSALLPAGSVIPSDR